MVWKKMLALVTGQIEESLLFETVQELVNRNSPCTGPLLSACCVR